MIHTENPNEPIPHKTAKKAGFITVVVIGFLTVMLLLSFNLYKRYSQQVKLSTVGDKNAVARYFLESYAADILWQIRKGRNQEGTALFEAFRNGTAVTLCPVDYRPSSMIKQLAEELGITIGPMVVNFDALEPLTFSPAAFRIDSGNEEKKGHLAILCEISYDNRDYCLEVRQPFKVVMTATPVLRKFVLFFDQLHLEQTEPFGVRDKINTIPIRNNRAPAQYSPLTLYGWDFENRDINGQVFLGADDHEIRLNLVGGAFQNNPSESRADLEDLWQISPSAFDITAGLTEFDQEELLKDSRGNPLIIRGASIPMTYRGHYSRIGLLGFSDEILDSEFLGNFKIENFLSGDPSFNSLRYPDFGMKQSATLRLFGNRVLEEFKGFPRDVFGKVYSRFFLLSFFDAPSIGVPIAFNPNPAHTITVPQYGGAQNLPFRPVSGTYTDYMSRVVSGGAASAVFGAKANVPTNRDAEFRHKLMESTDFAGSDGLKLSRGFSDISEAWFPLAPGTSDARPAIVSGSCFERISKFYRSGDDFKKAAGLRDHNKQKFWIDGVVYVNGSLDLSEGISTDNIRGGIVLVNGEIKLGDVTRNIGTTLNTAAFAAIKNLQLDQLLTFVSLNGQKIALTGKRYYGVQLLSFKPGLYGPVEQIAFDDGNELVFIGGMGMNTPNLAVISRQLKNRGIFPFINYLPAMAAEVNSYTVNIDERIEQYEFTVR
ncbi:MAG: hypothetical protein CVV42_05555 [Candidatus Riflebacteria bacterium HGW-Riflebacteria-2]|jgi:hypothetical protein|nr:MAG: hypothetical protein CVV42_05555 [Candidatus Riflebacteria bacterium HGW-Riflebacteria-2]